MGDFRGDKETPKRESDWLSLSRKNVMSQSGEDGVIGKIFDVIGETNKWCVEFGAGDGKLYSNTYNLLVNRGWSGVQIEADARKFEALTRTHQGNARVICLNASVSFEGADALENILRRTPVPKNIDLLSIDIDGNDYHIWDSLRRYNPRVVIVEFNHTIPPDIEFVQPKDMRVSQGSSVLSLTRLARGKGYELVSMTDLNALFVKEEYYRLFEIEDNSPSRLCKNRKCFTRLFQLHDGTLVLSGYNRLIWHDIEIGQEHLQIVPRFLRTYPPNFNAFQRQAVKAWKYGGVIGLVKHTIKNSFLYPFIRPLHERRLERRRARKKQGNTNTGT